MLSWVLAAWLVSVVMLIAYRILTGKISLRGLLTIDGDRFSPERLQLLLMTLGLLTIYVQDAVSSWSMRPASDELATVLAASQVLYLGGKFAER
jgi:hypothetical protein